MNLLPEDPVPENSLSNHSGAPVALEAPPWDRTPLESYPLSDESHSDRSTPLTEETSGETPPPEAPPPADKPQPVSEKERLTTVDLLRGFALLGILLMNILSFSWPDGAYGSANHIYYDRDSIGDIPKEDKGKKEEAQKEEAKKAEEKKAPKPIYAGGEVRIAAVEGDADRYEYVFATLLANNKMRTLFSMLFGAGVLLMAEHSRGKKISPAWLHYRRMFWMLVIGAFHAYFIWIGDILFGYACIGLVIYPMRWIPGRWLMAIGLFFFLFPIGIFWCVPPIVNLVRERGREVAKTVEVAKELKAAQKAELEKTYGISLSPAASTDAAKPTAEGEKPSEPVGEKAPPVNVGTPDAPTPAEGQTAPESKPEAKQAEEDYKPPFPDSLFLKGFQSMERQRIEGRHPERMTQAIRDHYSQSYFTWFTERAMNIVWMHLAFLFIGFLIMGWPMVIGMSLMKMGFFEGKWSTIAYGRWAVVLYLIGIPAEWYSMMLALDPRTSSMAWEMRVIQPLETLAMLTLTLANASALLWLFKTGRINWIAWRLEAVGRMALSNYLFDSVFCTILFSKIGPGWFGELSRIQLAGVVAGIWAFQLLISPIWLHYYRFGPMEWLWRSLTYWKIQPLRIAKAKVAAA